MRIGRIHYTNDLPIYCAFDVGAVEAPGTLVADVPSVLNARLLDGTLDLSPVSAYFYAEHTDRLALLPDICIGSRDEVWSVILASRRGPAELEGAQIAVTTESASGRNLLRILLERRFGVRAEFVDHDDPLAAAMQGMPALLIGDRAIDAQRALGPDHIHDLGKLWHEWTGLDMVYAVWAVRRDVLALRPSDVAVALQRLRDARAWGLEHLERVIHVAQAWHPRGEGFYAAYYATLNFALDARARAGLQRFFDESLTIGTLAGSVSAEPEETGVGR